MPSNFVELHFKDYRGEYHLFKLPLFTSKVKDSPQHVAQCPRCNNDISLDEIPEHINGKDGCYTKQGAPKDTDIAGYLSETAVNLSRYLIQRASHNDNVLPISHTSRGQNCLSNEGQFDDKHGSEGSDKHGSEGSDKHGSEGSDRSDTESVKSNIDLSFASVICSTRLPSPELPSARNASY